LYTPDKTFFLDGAHSGQPSADPAKHFRSVEIRERADPAQDPIASWVSHFHQMSQGRAIIDEMSSRIQGPV